MTRPRRVRHLVLPAVVLLAACGPAASPPQPAPEIDAGTWVEQQLRRLTLEQKLAQMVVVTASPAHLEDGGPAAEQLNRWVREVGIGGMIVAPAEAERLARSLNRLQARASVPLLIGSDPRALVIPRADGGTRGSRLVFGGVPLPYDLGVGATDDPALAGLQGEIVAREARAAGVHWGILPWLATSETPVPDRDRYGSNPEDVARLAAGFVRGAESAGLLTTAVLPGGVPLGPAAPPGSPAAAPTAPIDGSAASPSFPERQRLVAAIEAGASTLLLDVAPALAAPRPTLLPAESSQRSRPAQAPGAPRTAPSWPTADWLRSELGYDGIVAAAPDTADVAAGITSEEAVVRAVEAGADLVIGPPDPEAALAALVAATRTGRISAEQVNASAERLLLAKARLNLHAEPLVDVNVVHRLLGAPENRTAAGLISERSVVLLGDSSAVLPIDPRFARTVALVVLADPDAPLVGGGLATELRRLYADVQALRLDGSFSVEARESALARIEDADAIVLASYLSSAAPGAEARLAATMARLAQSGTPLVVTSFGEPVVAASAARDHPLLLAWHPADIGSERAIARAVAGVGPISGRLPVALPGLARGAGAVRTARSYLLAAARPEDVGMSARGLDSVDVIIRRAITNGASPGIALAVGRHGRLVRLRGYGRTDWRDQFPAVDDSTIYDIASLTKVIATTTAAMVLAEEGRLDLSAPIRRYLPEWRGTPAKESVTIRHLLTHTSGLPAWERLGRSLRGRADFRRRISGMGLEYAPGTRTVYSDLGMILLALILEDIAGQPLDVFLEERVWQPLEMRETRFNPIGPPSVGGRRDAYPGASDEGAYALVSPELLARIAPTEADSLRPGGYVHGVVHDENAAGIGGVAGHAGLFSSARDLAAFAQMMLNGGFYGDARVLRPGTIREWTQAAPGAGSRALGWDTPAPRSSAGDYFSPSSFGHTGFTGTSIWIDPERDVFVVLLTNRVNPNRNNQRHIALRRDVHDAVQRAITDLPVQKRRDVTRR